MLKNLILFLIILSFQTKISAQPSADDIIAKSVKAYGGQGFSQCEIDFDFRDKSYRLKHDNGRYAYYRIFQNEEGKVIDKLSNSGFERTIDGNSVVLSSIMKGKYSNSVNSVMYFALLPFKLLDPAVLSTYVGMVAIGGRGYHKIKVTFRQESGGEDFEDVFMYWFDTVDFSMDYLAYSYQTEGRGLRFRKARNKRSVNGLVFQDYDNYKADPRLYAVGDLDKAFENGELELLSVIELKKIEVKK